MGKKKSSSAFTYDIYCGQCQTVRFRYAKGSSGGLLRCFIGNITVAPDLELWRTYKSKADFPNLNCSKCGHLMAVPMVYKDGRLAFRMLNGGFGRKKVKG